MWAALGEILPIAVAVAFSSVPVMVTILILLSPNSRPLSITFLIGWVLGLALVMLAFTWLAYFIPSPPPRRSQVTIGVLMILVGVAVIVAAIILWRRGTDKPRSELPAWMADVGKLHPWQAFGLALLLNIRPKAILLSIAGGLSIRSAQLSTGETAIVIGVYTILAASAVAFPIIASLIAREKTKAGLIKTRTWITDNGRTVGALILIVIGVVIIGNGLSRL